MRLVAIGDVVGEPSTWNPQESTSREPFRYIDISSVDAREKRITGTTTLNPSEAPSRARQLVQPGDVLVSTVRPNLNAVAIVPDELDGATASTGFAVLRPNAERIEPSYLYQGVRSPGFVRGMIARATGASYPAVTERVVRKSTIPLPPLAEQRRIAAMLDKADAIRRKRREAIRLLEEFLRSAFLDMFGDPVRNPKGWEVVRLQDLCSRVVDCPHSTPKYAAGVTDFPCIRTSDLQGGFLDWSSTKYVKQDHYDERIGRHVPAEGDVLYSREGERFGIGALLPSNTRVCLGQRMMLFRPDAKSVTSAFLWGLLNSGGVYHMANQLVGGSTSPHINVHDIRQFRVYKPPLDLQMTYEKTYLTAAACREKIIGVGTRECEALFNSLAQEAFGGEG